MRKDTPVSTQLPEWKKEVAEKVRAYGERKKRLTTPPHPLKESEDAPVGDLSVKPVIPLPEQREPGTSTARSSKPSEVASQRLQQPMEETSAQPSLDVWTSDVQDFSAVQQNAITAATGDDVEAAGPYLLRRVLAGFIDHAILIALAVAMLFLFSIVLNKSIEWLIFSSWKGTLALFLLTHFIYHLYFFRSSRQTPGMLFVSLELRDPVIPVIPWGKIIVRWFAYVLLNVFNLVPVLLGKKFLLHDQISGTQMRSFQ